MERFLKEITSVENMRRIPLTKKYPGLLPLVLEGKRSFYFLKHIFNTAYYLHKVNDDEHPLKWFNLTEHSSPLYRKYNKKELDEGKIENIKIAVQSLNEIIVPPGKVFSFWKFVGRPSAGKGFKNGLVLSDGTLKEDMGGGLCQLSNLIAYMFACTECEFVERKHHSRDVFPDSGRSVPFASGATVFFNLIDLKIKNTYSFPIKINLHVTETQLRGSVSAPCSLGYFVKLEEKEACFIRSAKTNCIYRCNELYRVFYTKGIKQKMRESLLWKNVAKVIYEEKDIKSQIYTL